uniref:Uncharacterized protein n=1 Tax=Neobodo designis TaxID=312471 RepID=A0A7S1KXK1_NEODS
MPPKKSRRAPKPAASAKGGESVLSEWRTSLAPQREQASELVSPIDEGPSALGPLQSTVPEFRDGDSVISNSRATTPEYVPAADRLGLDAPAMVFFEESSREGSQGVADEPGTGKQKRPATKKHRSEAARKKR